MNHLFNFRLEDHVNFLSILNLINFGSGYRKELHSATNRGAYETILYGSITLLHIFHCAHHLFFFLDFLVLSMHLSQDKLDASFLSKLTNYEVATYFTIPLVSETEVQPGLHSVIPHPLKVLADLITKVLNESGQILKQQNARNFADWIFQMMAVGQVTASALVTKLVATFPAFRDVAMYKGQEVLILKKVQLLVGDLYREFAEKDTRFHFPDIDQLTVFTDNVLPAVLRKVFDVFHFVLFELNRLEDGDFGVG